MKINNELDLISFKEKVDEGRTFEGKTVEIMSDIDLSTVCHSETENKPEKSWQPIANNVQFKGTFDGNNHKISNLYLRGDDYQYAGLFSENFGTIQNIVLENVDIYNTYHSNYHSWTGGIAGKSYSTIKNCIIKSGKIEANSSFVSSDSSWNVVGVGGIVGQFVGGELSKCANGAEVKGTSTKSSYNAAEIGGMIGQSSSEYSKITIQECYNYGKVSAEGCSGIAGGIVGQLHNTTYESGMFNCYNSGTVSGVGNFSPARRNYWRNVAK